MDAELKQLLISIFENLKLTTEMSYNALEISSSTVEALANGKPVRKHPKAIAAGPASGSVYATKRRDHLWQLDEAIRRLRREP